MKSKKIYSLFSITLVLLASYIFFNSSHVDSPLSTNTALADDQSPVHPANNSTITSAQLDKIISSVKQLQEKINSQDKKFQDELALLRTSQLNANQPENSYQEEQNDDITALEKEQQSHAVYQKRTDAIEMALANEGSNERMTQEVQQRFEAALKVSDSNMSIQNITCSGSICKLSAEVHGGNMSLGPKIDHLVYGDMDWDGPTLSKYDADTGEVTIFLMPPGADMSIFDPDTNVEL